MPSPRSGSSAVAATSPSSGGGSPSVGVSSRSKPSSNHHDTTRRVHRVRLVQRADVVGAARRAAPARRDPRERLDVVGGERPARRSSPISAMSARERHDQIVRERVDQRRLRRARPATRSSTVWPSDSSSARRVLGRGDARRDRSPRAPPGASVRSADAQPAGIGADLVRVRTRRRRRGVGVAGHVALRARRAPPRCRARCASTTCRTTRPPQPSLSSGPSETRPRDGFSPTRPHMLAGMRIEPPPSLACATGTMPLATAAAEPPLEPPGRARRVPRVARRAVRLGLGRRHEPELGRVRLADDHEARRARASSNR